MRNGLVRFAFIVYVAGITQAVPVVYTDEGLYLDALTVLGYSPIHESFENNTVWADSRNSISSPGSTPVVISEGIV